LAPRTFYFLKRIKKEPHRVILSLLKTFFQSNFVKVAQAKLTEDQLNVFLTGVVNENSLDVVVSNPPYILRKDLRNLQPEIAM